MSCLASLVVLFPSQVKKTTTYGRKLEDIHSTSCYPDRLEYMIEALPKFNVFWETLLSTSVLRASFLVPSNTRCFLHLRKTP